MALHARHEAIAQRLADFFGVQHVEALAAVKQQIGEVKELLDGTGLPCLIAHVKVCSVLRFI